MWLTQSRGLKLKERQRKMPVDLQDFINIIAEICEEKKLVVCVKECLKGALVTGASSLIGGLLLGPFGLALGGALGGTASAVSSQGKFKPVAVIVKEMSHTHKQKIYERIKYAFRNVGVEDFLGITTLIMTQISFKELAIKEVTNYLCKDMGLTVRTM